MQLVCDGCIYVVFLFIDCMDNSYYVRKFYMNELYTGKYFPNVSMRFLIPSTARRACTLCFILRGIKL